MKIKFAKPKALTLKQYRFILAYLASGNGTQSAKEAGYKGSDATLNSVAMENLRKPLIVEWIEKLTEREGKIKIASAELVLETLTRELLAPGDDKANTRIRAAHLLGKRYGSFISPKADRKLDLEILEAEHSEAMAKLQREDAQRRFGANVPLVEEGRFYPAGGLGVGPCLRYHAALDPSLYPGSPLLAALRPGGSCPLCGGLSPMVPKAKPSTGEELEEGEEDE